MKKLILILNVAFATVCGFALEKILDNIYQETSMRLKTLQKRCDITY